MAEKNLELMFRPQAQRDLDEVKKRLPRTWEEILKKIELIKEFPEMGPKMDQVFYGFRQILCGNYRIIYEIISDTQIEIAYVRHCS